MISTKHLQIHQAARTIGLMAGAVMVCYLPLVVKWHLCGLNSQVYSFTAQVGLHMIQALRYQNIELR